MTEITNIEGIVVEIREGMECDTVIIQSGKKKSILRLGCGECEKFTLDEKVTIVLRKDIGLFGVLTAPGVTVKINEVSGEVEEMI